MFVCILKDEIGTVDYYCATRVSRGQQDAASKEKPPLLAWQMKFN
jgi:hypothetical protein